MTRYLLDTNIISNAVKPAPSPELESWMAAQIDSDLFISTITLGEISRGILQLPEGRRRDRLVDWFNGPTGPGALFATRILSFDEAAALIWADLMATGSNQGRSRSAIDTMIGAIARANLCVLVTGNVRHFPDIELFNPLNA
jgi:predicted nucleic acid-binding protein